MRSGEAHGPFGLRQIDIAAYCGLLERPDGGDVVVGGQSRTDLNDNERTLVRRHQIGFVYQYHHLMPEFSALENACYRRDGRCS